MQCASCQTVYSNALEACPRCQGTADASLSAPNHSASNTESALTADQAGEREAAPRRAARATAPPPNVASTLIEFPGTARAQQPAWRKELGERVREIQERRAREATQDEATDGKPSHFTFAPHRSPNASQPLGLVPPPPPSEDRPHNPIVAAALARVERARQTPSTAAPRSSAPMTSGATAHAIAAEPVRETLEPVREPVMPAAPPPTNNANGTQATNGTQANKAQATSGAATGAAPRCVAKVPAPHGIDVNSPAYLKHKREEEARNRAKQLAAKQLGVPHARSAASATPLPRTNVTPPATNSGVGKSGAASVAATPAPAITAPEKISPNKTAATEAKQPVRRIAAEVLDEALLARREAEAAAAEAAERRKSPGDFAPLTARLAGGIIDMLAIVFISSPIAATFELIFGDWSNSRVMLLMAISIAVLTFLYITAATALAGRTWGMSLVNLRAIDVETGMTPTTSQAVRRGAAYVFSLAVFGLGFLYALIDPERRGAHDHFSGTVVVRE